MNAKVEAARQTALDLLKPSPKSLEHGLALHADALVIEPYCLGLRAPFDPEPVNERIERHATETEVVECYGECSTLGWARKEQWRQQYREIWETAGVDAVFQNAGEEGNDPLRLLYRFSNYAYLAEAMPETVQKIVTPDDILAARRSGRRAIGLACNGVPLPAHPYSVGEGLSLIRVFAKLGMRMAHLTYNRRNLLGDGCGERANGGLSDFGRQAIDELNRSGVMVDVAHTGWQSSLEAVQASDRPVVISHSTACGVHETMRGKPDNVLRALADKGGVIGITNVPGFLGHSQDIVALLDHIDYVIRHFGEDVVGIGTDAGYAPPEAEAIDARLIPRPKQAPHWESLWPGGDIARGRDPRAAQSLCWTNRPLFTVGMVERGHRDETIRKILGGNLMRVFREVWNRSELKMPAAAGRITA